MIAGTTGWCEYTLPFSVVWGHRHLQTSQTRLLSAPIAEGDYYGPLLGVYRSDNWSYLHVNPTWAELNTVSYHGVTNVLNCMAIRTPGH